MDCSKCNLRYNTSKRRPKVNQCGHTICELCASKLSLCPTCNLAFDRTKMTVNHSLMEMLSEKKATKDIDKLIKVCFVGESKAGKTSLINRMKGAAYNENTVTTIGYDFAFEDREIDELQVRFQLWDSAGQERFRAVSPLHYKNSDIIVIVYDMTVSGKLNNISHWLQEANRHSPEGAVKILVGNKIDLLESRNNIKPMNSLDEATWKAVAAEKIKNYQISCKTYEGIEQFWGIIQSVVRTILEKIVIKHSPFKQIGAKEARRSKTPRDERSSTMLKSNTKKEHKSRQSFCC